MAAFFDRLLAQAPEAARALGAREAVELRFEELAAAAAAAWPGVQVEREALAAAVADKLAGGAEAPPFGPELFVELHLALACARGDATALARFEERYLDVVPGALASMRLPEATVDGVRAAVREKLLLAEGDRPPRILEYAGRGRLRGLVKVSAVRAALDALRAADRAVPLAGEELAALPSPDFDPELQLMKGQYRTVFAAAFAEAARALGSRDRNLLRLHFLDGVPLDRLAVMYGVHRATVVRWIASVRKDLLGATRQGMRARLEVSSGELDSVMRLIESRLDVSLKELLSSIDAGHDGGPSQAPPS